MNALGGRIPIIKLYGNLIVPIQVALSDEVAQTLRDDVTDRIQEAEVRSLIVDVSGVDILDSYLSRSIHDLALIAQLQGVHTVICGLDPTMALTLTEMGLRLEGVATALHLEAAIEQLQDSVAEEESLEEHEIFQE